VNTQKPRADSHGSDEALKKNPFEVGEKMLWDARQMLKFVLFYNLSQLPKFKYGKQCEEQDKSNPCHNKSHESHDRTVTGLRR
jgi:nitrate reductase beta subunit